MCRDCNYVHGLLHITGTVIIYMGCYICAQALGEAFPDLDAIDLSGCESVTDEGLATLAKSCPRLHPGNPNPNPNPNPAPR